MHELYIYVYVYIYIDICIYIVCNISFNCTLFVHIVIFYAVSNSPIICMLKIFNINA